MAVYSDKYNYIFFANPNTASKAIAKTLKEKLDGKRIPGKEVRDPKTGKVIVRAHHCTHDQLVKAGLMTPERLDSMFKFTGVRNPYDQMVSKYVKHCERLHNDPANYRWNKLGSLPGETDLDDLDDDEDSPKPVKANKAGKLAKADKGDKPNQAGKNKAAKAQAADVTGEQAKLAKKALATTLADPALALAQAGTNMTEAQADFLNWLRHMDARYQKVDKLEKGPLDFLERADYVIRFEALQEGFSEVVKRIGSPEPVQIVEFNITKAREVAPKKKKSYKDYYVAESQAIVARMFATVIERFGYQF